MDLEALNDRLAGVTAVERVRLAHEAFGEDLILATSFGRTAGVMLRLATEVYPGIRVINVRHGYESKQTLRIADVYRLRLKLNLKVYEAPKVLIPDEGTPEFEAFKQKVKIEPFQRALRAERPRAWLSGVMREETEARRSFDYVMQRDGLVVVYPLLDWEETDAEEFCLAHGLPLNPSYYDPTKGLDQKSECGLHMGKLGSSWTSSEL